MLLGLYIRSHYDHRFHRLLYDIEVLCKGKANLDAYIDLKVLKRYLRLIPEIDRLLKKLEPKVKDWVYKDILEEVDSIRCLFFMRRK